MTEHADADALLRSLKPNNRTNIIEKLMRRATSYDHYNRAIRMLELEALQQEAQKQKLGKADYSCEAFL